MGREGRNSRRALAEGPVLAKTRSAYSGDRRYSMLGRSPELTRSSAIAGRPCDAKACQG